MNTACSIPGSVMLSVQLARPVTRAGSSLRHRPPPTYFSGAWVTLFPPLGRRVLNQLVPMLLDELDGLHDVLVACAAAQVPFQAFPYLPLRRVGILLKEADGGHDHARRAVATLQTVRLVESLLHRMPHTVLRNAPDGGDLVPVSLHRKDRARLDRLPVDVDRAGPATGRVAPRMHAPDPKVLPEMDSAPVRLAQSPRSTGFPQAAANGTYIAAFFLYIRRFCSLFPFCSKVRAV